VLKIKKALDLENESGTGSKINRRKYFIFAIHSTRFWRNFTVI